MELKCLHETENLDELHVGKEWLRHQKRIRWIKICKFCTSEITIKKQFDKPLTGRKCFWIMYLIGDLYAEYINLKRQILKWTSDSNRHFSKDHIQTALHMKRCVSPHVSGNAD